MRLPTRKARISVVIIAAIGSLIVGCSSSESVSSSSAGAAGVSNGSPIKAAFVCATAATDPLFGGIEQGAKEAAAQVGVDLTYTGLGTTVTPAAMAQLLTPAVNQHPNILIVCNFFPSADDPIIKRAVAQHIIVIATQSGVPNTMADGAVASVGVDSSTAGQQAADEMAAAGVKHPMCLDTVPSNPSVSERCTAFAAEFKSKGVLVKTVNLANGSFLDPTQVAADIKGTLASDHAIDGILTISDSDGQSAVLAVQQSGLAGKVKIGTFDVDTNIINDIKGGSVLFTVWQQPYLEGYLPVIEASLYARHGFTPPATLPTGPSFVTKSNVALVQEALAQGIG
jgi:simple sugar transport system substrate-binding protein